MKESRRLGGGLGFENRLSKMLTDILGVGVDQLETDFSEYVKASETVWVDLLRSLETSGETWHQIAFPDCNAMAWQTAPLPDSPVISMTATFLHGTSSQLNVRIGQPSSFTQFSITAGFGINLFQYADKKWNMVATKEIDGIKVGTSMAIEVVHQPKSESIEFKLDGVSVYKGELKMKKGDRLGLSAQEGSIVAWKNVKVSKRDGE